MGTGAINVICNSTVIVGENQVMIVDSGASPRAARALLEETKAYTSKPVRYVVNTHFHFDHTLGNAAFPSDVSIIAHEYTRAKIAGDPLHERSLVSHLESVSAQILSLKNQVAEQHDPDKQQDLLKRINVDQASLAEISHVIPRPPNVAMQDKLTLDLGGRTVEILHFGRGHPGGDVVVYLPKERVVCTGDFYNGYIGYMGDAYVDEWADSLGKLAELDFDTVIPGHGEPFKNKAKIAQVQTCMRDIWQRSVALWRQGVPAEAAAQQIDLKRYAGAFPQFRTAGLSPIAVVRIYELMKERSKQPAGQASH